MEQIKLICCDVDGTLVRDDKSLSQENINWIKKAVDEKGITFVIVSGRPYFGVKRYYSALGISGLASCFNGGVLYDSDGSIISERRMPDYLARRILSLPRPQSVDSLIFDNKDWYIADNDNPAYQARKLSYGNKCCFGKDLELLDRFETNKVIFVSSVKEDLVEMAKRVRDSLSGPEEAKIYMGPDFFEVNYGKIDKGDAIDALMEHFRLKPEEIMALGDDYNDIGMLSKAGCSVAMGNAAEEVKAVAKHITLSNTEDGVAHAIKTLIFGLAK